MTPEYIIRKSLCRLPHCWYSQISGFGSVGFDKDDPKPVKWGIVDPDFRAKWHEAAENELGELVYCFGYAEPGYTQPKKGLILGNWNVFPTDLCSILERYGYDCAWSDEWDVCVDCEKALLVEPDSYDWKPYFCPRERADDDFLCVHCADLRDE